MMGGNRNVGKITSASRNQHATNDFKMCDTVIIQYQSHRK